MGGLRKELISYRGITLIERVHKVLSSVFQEICLAGRPDDEGYGSLCISGIFPDEYPGRGPLAGIHAALKATGQTVFVTACDTPLLDAGLIREQVNCFREGIDALVPRHPRGFEPLHAVYTPSCLSVAEAILRENERPRIIELLNSVKTYYWDIEYHEAFSNFNKPEDFR